jgi:hypothetical protein
MRGKFVGLAVLFFIFLGVCFGQAITHKEFKEKQAIVDKTAQELFVQLESGDAHDSVLEKIRQLARDNVKYKGGFLMKEGLSALSKKLVLGSGLNIQLVSTMGAILAQSDGSERTFVGSTAILQTRQTIALLRSKLGTEDVAFDVEVMRAILGNLDPMRVNDLTRLSLAELRKEFERMYWAKIISVAIHHRLRVVRFRIEDSLRTRPEESKGPLWALAIKEVAWVHAVCQAERGMMPEMLKAEKTEGFELINDRIENVIQCEEIREVLDKIGDLEKVIQNLW